MKLDLNPPKGTRDFFPEELRLRNWLFEHFHEVARTFGFEEYDAPVLESEELYIRKAGEEITGQLYNFEDKGGRHLALRPEMTPSLARLVMQKGRSLAFPIKWYSIPQCFRYERMTRGRKREHYQWNMDILGVSEVTAEAELLSAMTTLFARVGLSAADVGIKVSSRKVLQAVLERLGVSQENFAAVCVVVDKLEKLPRDVVEEEMKKLGLSPTMVSEIIESLSIRSLQALQKQIGKEHAASQDLEKLFELAQGYGFADWLVLDVSVVRGLAYYTGVVFEAFDRKETLRAICGGGRYDKLLSMFGGENVPACGFGFGDVVIFEVLKERNLVPELTRRVDDVVYTLDESLRLEAARVVNELRRKGRVVDFVLEERKLKAALKHADRVQAQRIVLFAPEEWSKGHIKVRDLKTGQEQSVNAQTLLER